MRYFMYITFAVSILMARPPESQPLPKIFVTLESGAIQIPSSFSQGVNFLSARNFFLFEPSKADIDTEQLESLIGKYGNYLVRNPDAILTLKGFYSSKIDDILSPRIGMELAKKRADALFRAIVLKFPSIGDRVFVSDDHNFETTFLDSVSPFDMRVEFEIFSKKYHNRKFYPKQRAPYWRESYKNIIKNIAPDLEQIFSSNPDIDALIIGNGFSPDRKGYQWLEFLKKRICERMDERFSQRIALYINPFSKQKTPSAELILIPSINCGGMNEILWSKPNFSSTVTCSIDGIQTLPNKFYCSFNIFDKFRAKIDCINSSSLNIEIGDIPILPTDLRLDFISSEFGIAQKSPILTIQSTDSFSGVWNFTIWKPELKRFSTFGGAGMWNVANAIYSLSKIADRGKITMIANGSNDSLALVDAQKFWDILTTQICSISDTKRDKLGSWFEKNNFEVELSPPVKNNDESLEINFVDSNSIKIIIQFLGNKK
ncbi:hypothetical protein J7L68_03820 [bacterium]|nr:hypothetical protein [bacterium]